MIPRNVHFIWMGDMPGWVEANIARWRMLNPEYNFFIHDGKNIPNRYKWVFNRVKEVMQYSKDHKLPDICSLSDVVRLAWLREHGGWYFDCDIVPFKPIDELCTDYNMRSRPDCYVPLQWQPGPKRISNAVIGLSTSAEAWNEIDAAINEFRDLSKPIERTTFGPLLMTRLSNRCPAVTIGKLADFYHIRFNPVGTAIRIYKELHASNFSQAVIDKYFVGVKPYGMHLWMGNQDYGDPVLTKLAPKKIQTPQGTQKKVCVTCVLRSGGDYTEEYVHRLQRNIAKHLPIEHDFVCLTDVPETIHCKTVALKHNWPGWWSKIELFRPDLFKGYDRVIYFDLDTIAVGDLSGLVTEPCKFAMLRGFRNPKRRGSGVMVWEGDHSFIYQNLMGKSLDKDDWDQLHILRELKQAKQEPSVIQDMANVVSYKWDVIDGAVPVGTKIVCFHGQPRPVDVKEDWVKQEWV